MIAAGATFAEAQEAINFYVLGPEDDDSGVPTGGVIIQRLV